MANALQTSFVQLNATNCYIGCIAHVINLAARSGYRVIKTSDRQPSAASLENLLDGPSSFEAGSVIEKLHSLAKTLKKSPQEAKLFAEIVQSTQPNTSARTLIMDVPTRWNATHAMVQRCHML